MIVNLAQRLLRTKLAMGKPANSGLQARMIAAKQTTPPRKSAA